MNDIQKELINQAVVLGYHREKIGRLMKEHKNILCCEEVEELNEAILAIQQAEKKLALVIQKWRD